MALVPRLLPRNTLLLRLLPQLPDREAGASGQCVPGLEPRNEMKKVRDGGAGRGGGREVLSGRMDLLA